MGELATPGRLRTEYLRLDDIVGADRNAQQHDVPGIAAAIRRLGYADPVLIDERTGKLVGGHGRLKALRRLRDQGHPAPSGIDPADGWLVPVTYGWSSIDDAHAEAANLALNRWVEKGGQDDRVLADILDDLLDVDPSLAEAAGYTAFDLDELLASLGPAPDLDETPGASNPRPPDERDGDDEDDEGQAGRGVPAERDLPERADVDLAPAVTVVTTPGDIWLLGRHRLGCLDSTDPAAVARLVDGATLALIHADPPYGMGKESDGVLNDNLYREDLDRFQMAWWSAWLPHLAGNGSTYIWGQAPDLWRLWWRGGLGDQSELVMRNEIVWDKGSVPGMRWDGAHSYPPATERCLFFMRGEQFLGNQNKDQYWEGWEPLRTWLCAEVKRAGWTARDVNQITGTQMSGHWLTKSQFMPIGEPHYTALQREAAGRAFTPSYDDLFELVFPGLRDGGNANRRDLSAQLRQTRSHFDNTHDTMTDVWRFDRVTGDDRHGHATPKPVAIVERAFRSSSRPGDAIGVPFGGSGPDVVAAERLGRTAQVAELSPAYVDVIARRWQALTGEYPVLERTGEAWDLTATPPRAVMP